jgi:multiple sugar transport system substrate-binding protein
MKHLRLPVVLAAGALALTACAGVGKKDAGGGSGDQSSAASTPTGSLKVMGFSGEDEVAQSRITAFKTAFPGVTVQNNKGDFDAQQFLTAVSSGNPPDVVYMARNLVGTYAAKGAIQPLDDCIKNAGIDTTQYREAALNEVKLKDKTYGIPEFYTVSTNLISETALKSVTSRPPTGTSSRRPRRSSTRRRTAARPGSGTTRRCRTSSRSGRWRTARSW